MPSAVTLVFDVLWNPVVWIVVLWVLGAALGGAPGAARAGRRGAHAWGLLAAGLLLVLSLEPVSNRLLWYAERMTPSSMRPGVTYDAVIVLGGAVDHAPTESHGVPCYKGDAERVMSAYDLLRTGRARDAIVTGGRVRPDDPIVEARVLARQLEDWGIARERIALAEHSRDTREDAIEAKAVAGGRGYRTLLLLTSARHMPRAVERFSAVGLRVDTLSVDFRSFDPSRRGSSLIPRARHLADSVDVLRDLMGKWLYRGVDRVTG